MASHKLALCVTRTGIPLLVRGKVGKGAERCSNNRRSAWMLCQARARRIVLASPPESVNRPRSFSLFSPFAALSRKERRGSVRFGVKGYFTKAATLALPLVGESVSRSLPHLSWGKNSSAAPIGYCRASHGHIVRERRFGRPRLGHPARDYGSRCALEARDLLNAPDSGTRASNGAIGRP